MDNETVIEWKPWKDVMREALNEFKKKKRNSEDDYEKLSENEYSGPVFQTELGIFPIMETNLPSAVFNFWRGDTHFILTKRMAMIIMNTLGVETFNVYTPYRFRIAVGKRFNATDVCKRIDDAIKPWIPQMKEKSKSNLYEVLHKQYKFFAVVEDEIKKVLSGDTKEEVENKLKEFKVKPEIKVYYSWKH